LGASAVTDNPLGFSVADNFDWNTLHNIRVTVKTDGNYSKYGISLYDENPAGNDNANLLAEGTVTSSTNQFTEKYIEGANVYKAKDTNLVWGICLPAGAAYNWPTEKTSIKDINSYFVNWCKTNGSQDTDWYNK
jgi:LruC domain-containing protein